MSCVAAIAATAAALAVFVVVLVAGSVVVIVVGVGVTICTVSHNKECVSCRDCVCVFGRQLLDLWSSWGSQITSVA